MNLEAQGPVKQVLIDAVVIRADGTREDLGTISNSDWNGIRGFFNKDRRAASKRIKAANEKVS